MRYIIGAKEGDHSLLFSWVNASDEVQALEYQDIKGTTHKFRFLNSVPLNDANFDFKVNFLEYWQIDSKRKVTHFSWVTDLFLTKENVDKIMKAGRTRWKIENETFNTLKNQGYNFEHNFGHGEKNLCSVFAMLMMLSFLIDQAQELCCSLYKKARIALRTKYSLWEKMRVCFEMFNLESWEQFYTYMAFLDGMPLPVNTT